MTHIVPVLLPHHRYEVHIAPGILGELGSKVRAVAPHDRAALIADKTLSSRVTDAARQSLQAAGYEALLHTIPAGEEHKNLQTVSELYEVLLNRHMERKSPVLALGGGVIGDTVGFVAATYLRGVPFVQCPTTLLAMVDASVGGKVGVNVPQGKNLVGAFHQPHLVLIDTNTLSSLPPRELRCGLAECVKHGLIRDPELFDWLEQHAAAIERLDPPTLAELVARNVRIKAQVVMADEKESGERAHLNFGHTFAHAIEATQGLGESADAAGRGSKPSFAYHHGEAVSLGMVAAARLAVNAGRCPRQVLDRLIALLERVGLPTRAERLAPNDQLLAAMRLDKKVKDSRLRLILPDRLGSVSIASDIPDLLITTAWDSLR